MAESDPYAEIREALDCLERTNISGADHVERHVEIGRAALSRLEREAAERETALAGTDAENLSLGRQLEQAEARVREVEAANESLRTAWRENVEEIRLQYQAVVREVEAERDRLKDALREIASNAEAWHGHRPDHVDGHVRALRVIAGRARAVLASPEAPACPDCDGRGEVSATPGQPGDGPMPCPTCSPEAPAAEPIPALQTHPSVAKMLDRAVRVVQAQRAALETVRAELDLPEHLAEIVGDALAKDVGRAAALPAVDAPPEPTTSAWLIERGQSEQHTPTVWWIGDPEATSREDENWTTDAFEATWFARREAAQAIVDRLFTGPGGRDVTARAVEHGFVRGQS